MNALAIDGNAIARRFYHAVERVNSRGENVFALEMWGRKLMRLHADLGPGLAVVAWDGFGETWRHALYPGYKANRGGTPGGYAALRGPLEEVAAAIGFGNVRVAGFEADDVLATLARNGECDGVDVALVTSDKDMLQLVSERVRLLSPVGRSEEYVWMDRDAVWRKWGVEPEQTREVLALMGDSADNIPGVRGVGEKTAIELIAHFGSVAEMYRRIDDVDPMVRKKLEVGRADASLSLELVGLRGVPGVAWTTATPTDRAALDALSARYEVRFG